MNVTVVVLSQAALHDQSLCTLRLIDLWQIFGEQLGTYKKTAKVTSL